MKLVMACFKGTVVMCETHSVKFPKDEEREGSTGLMSNKQGKWG